METNKSQSSFHVWTHWTQWKRIFFLLCDAFWRKKHTGKFSRTHVHRLCCKLCRISYEVHTAQSWFSGGKGTVTGDVWPIFSSSKCICSAQELHQLCFSLSPLFPSLWCSLSPCGHSLGASPSQSTNHLRCCSTTLPLLLLAFLQLCLSSLSSFLHPYSCSACVGVRLYSQATLKLFYSV